MTKNGCLYCHSLYIFHNRWPAVCIHGDKSQNERDWVLQGNYLLILTSCTTMNTWLRLKLLYFYFVFLCLLQSKIRKISSIIYNLTLNSSQQDN